MDIVQDDGTATLGAADRGLHYGDGLFETIACRQGRPRFLAAHFERLALGCARLGFPALPRQPLEQAIAYAAAHESAPRSMVKLILTRGSSSERGYAPPLVARPRCIVQAYPWPADTELWREQGIAAQYSPVPVTENPLLAGIKHLNRLDSVLARASLAGSGCTEALLLDAGGAVVCGSMSNLFIARGRHLLTPMLDRGGIAGIARAAMQRAALALGWEVRECRLYPADIEAADEVFVTNVRIGAWPIVRIGDREWQVGAMTRLLQQRFEAMPD